ncbi:MAG TPA: DUF1727 domain-containing protein [Candidatus Eubacterium faecipullorum]|uniref:Lipid II isoglutaminyl synthase (glutamine-hydrolyzing) subunit MurT n=1 Tax=Candidatus Eubacterium faecipullorum TaxID=2838571 RepID=A0A9D1RE85_9FIRM|nr:DUF1727 domain-containing protein [Candidatus Eubacterium faecipullorum]
MIITIIIALVRLCEKLLRLFGRGATSFPGKLALFLKKDILKSLSRGVRIIAVTGTNGKTTTCAMIESALKKAGISCFLNRSGANLITGVTAAFIANCNLFGRCRYDCAVLECDENALKKISLYIDAQILVVTNIFRDQLDRYGEVSSTLAAIREGAGNMKNALLVLNADDPLTFSLSRLGNPYVSFGISKRLSLGGRGESEFCPFCGTAYEYAFRTYSQLGGFYCPSCGYARETPDYSAEEVFLQDPDTSSFFAVFRGKAALVSVNLGGIYNVYNALAAAAALREFGVGLSDVENALSEFGGAFGRMERFENVRMLLVKNPAGFTQTVNYIKPLAVHNLIFVLNDNDADGKDVSWIWDAQIDIGDHVENVYAFGIRSGDMALRLKYAGIQAKIIKNYDEFKKITSQPDTVIIPTYTAMMALRPYFAHRSGKKEFWQ